MKKNALVVGGSGEIGGAHVKDLARRGYHVYVPARFPAPGDSNQELKPGLKEIMMLPNVTVSQCDVSKPENVDLYFHSLANAGVHIDLFVLAVGVWHRDGYYATKEQAFDELRKANVDPKENVYAGLSKYFADQQKDMVGIVVSSHAKDFTQGHKYYDEQVAYITISGEVSDNARAKAGRFRFLLVKEPGAINTEGYRSELGMTEEEAKRVPGILSPEVFASTSIDEVEKVMSIAA
jgi:NAD(P)-dependent dehydrogenase (short-subunit alcohol dehydrogenase family)